MGGRWFASLPPELRLAIVAASTVRTFEPGEALIRQGELPRGLCGVLEGRAQIARVLENGREVLLHVGGPGMWFGDWSVISGRPALYTTSAVTRCRALVLPLAAFRRLVDEQPRWYEEFNRYLLANMESFYVAFAAQVGLTAGSATGWRCSPPPSAATRA